MSSELSDKFVAVLGMIFSIAAVALLILGPVSCNMDAQREATQRVQFACAGNLASDSSRSAACILAIKDSELAGH